MSCTCVAHRGGGAEDTDDICLWCREWCTTKSICSNRYNDIQGEWIDPPPTNDPRLLPDEHGIAVVPICDQCVSLYELDETELSATILVMGRRFSFDGMHRVND